MAQRRWGAEDDEGRGAGDGAGAAEGAAAAHRHAADVQDSAAGAKLTTAVRAFAAAPGRAVLRALPRDAHGVPVLSVAGPPPASVAGREVAVASVVGREVAVAHLGLRERLHRGMLVVAGCAAAGGLLVQFLRQSGGSGALGEVARVLFAVAFLVFAGSRVVPTRERLRRRLLKLARRRRGRVGILDAAVTLKVPPEVARELLDGLVAIGLARPDPDREGAYLVLAS